MTTHEHTSPTAALYAAAADVPASSAVAIIDTPAGIEVHYSPTDLGTFAVMLLAMLDLALAQMREHGR